MFIPWVVFLDIAAFRRLQLHSKNPVENFIYLFIFLRSYVSFLIS